MKEQVKNNFSRHIEHYESGAVVQKKSARDLVDLLEGDCFEKVLDVGCGTGFVVEALEEKKKIGKVVGVDFAPKMQQHCQKKWPQYEFVCGDVEKDFYGQNYDLIVSNFSLHWFENIFFFIKNCVEKLNEKGVVAFAFPVQDSLKSLEVWSEKIVGKNIFLHPFLSEKKLQKNLDFFSGEKKNVGENAGENVGKNASENISENVGKKIGKNFGVKSVVKNYEQEFENPWEALCSIKKIGASYAHKDFADKSFSVQEMRRLKKSSLEIGKFKVHYRVFFLLITKK